MRTSSGILLAALGALLAAPLPVTAQDKEFEREKLLVEKKLDDARAELNGHLKDKKLNDVFSPRNDAVVAVLLVVTLRGDHVKEVKVYATRKGETGKKLVRILDDSKDPDFQTLVKVLKLGSL
jgi:hypothetical protein